MKIRLLDYTPNALNKIGAYAGICVGKPFDLSEKERNERRALSAITSGHLSVLRFAYATFEIDGVSRVCSHQLVRIAHAGILQESQRFTNQYNRSSIVPNSFSDTPNLKQKIEEHNIISLELYKEAVYNGIKKEDARFILPEGSTTKLIMTANFQTWMHFLSLRTDNSSQWEIRSVANRIKYLLNEVVPGVFL